MHAVPRTTRFGALGLGLAVLAVACLAAPRSTGAQPQGPVYAKDLPSTKLRQVQLMWQGARKHFTRAQLQQRRQSTGYMKPVGRRVRPAQPLAPVPGAPTWQPPLETQGTLAAPTNVKVNNKTGDAAASGQSEQLIALLGDYGLCAWNDGQGFVTGGSTQGVGYTVDGGATWTDLGSPPAPVGGVWSSDPVVTVNEKTGEFYYLGMIEYPGSSQNGLAVVRGTFSGTTFTWDTPHNVRVVANATDFLDKPWMVADSVTGNLYATYTHFTATSDSVIFQRSTNDGVSWGPMLTMNGSSAAGRVTGSRPVVGPAGEVYVTFYEIGLTDADFFRVRKSTNQGTSFAAQATGASYYDNYGTGAPGFNRDRGISFPGIAVDRSQGPQRGRVYLTWNECVDWYNDPLGGAGNLAESEPNNSSAAADPITLGRILTGALSSASDQDWFSFSATAGTSYIFVSFPGASFNYSLDVFCTNGTTHLSLSGDVYVAGGGGGQGNIVFTAPSTGTFYLRIAGVAGGGSGSYQILTGTNSDPTGDRSRDQRDIFVASSDNGSTWTTPVRVNDDPGRYDDWLPEVAVGEEGYPYVMWYDWRDDAACGGSSHIYTARSVDGGASWTASLPVTTAQSPWTTVASNIAPNQGDYNAMYAGSEQVAYNWSDGRLGDVDVFMAKLDARFTAQCPPDTTIDANTAPARAFGVNNNNVLFANGLNYTLTSERAWPGYPQVGSATFPSGASVVELAVSVPDTAASGVNRMCWIVTQPNGARADTCCSDVAVNSLVNVGPSTVAFSLSPGRPNPVKAGQSAVVQFALPRPGRATLRVFGLRGELVRTLFDGPQPAGVGTRSWDLRGDDGHVVASGVYYYRLEFEGRHLERRQVVVK
jgi:hypothetical protein